MLTLFLNSSNKGFLISSFFLYQWPLCAFCFIWCFPFIALSLCLFFVSALLPCSCWVNEKWQHTQTHVQRLFSLSQRELPPPSAPMALCRAIQGKKEMNALIKLEQVKINKECKVLTNDREGDWNGETDFFRNNWSCSFPILISLIYIKGLSMKFGILYTVLCLYLN